MDSVRRSGRAARNARKQSRSPKDQDNDSDRDSKPDKDDSSGHKDDGSDSYKKDQSPTSERQYSSKYQRNHRRRREDEERRSNRRDRDWSPPRENWSSEANRDWSPLSDQNWSRKYDKWSRRNKRRWNRNVNRLPDIDKQRSPDLETPRVVKDDKLSRGKAAAATATSSDAAIVPKENLQTNQAKKKAPGSEENRNKVVFDLDAVNIMDVFSNRPQNDFYGKPDPERQKELRKIAYSSRSAKAKVEGALDYDPKERKRLSRQFFRRKSRTCMKAAEDANADHDRRTHFSMSENADELAQCKQI